METWKKSERRGVEPEWRGAGSECKRRSLSCSRCFQEAVKTNDEFSHEKASVKLHECVCHFLTLLFFGMRLTKEKLRTVAALTHTHASGCYSENGYDNVTGCYCAPGCDRVSGCYSVTGC